MAADAAPPLLPAFFTEACNPLWLADSARFIEDAQN